MSGTIECERCKAHGKRGYEYAPLANVEAIGWRIESPILCIQCKVEFDLLVKRFLRFEIMVSQGRLTITT